VRRALSQLAAEGLVDLRPNRGAAVATPSWDEAHDTFEARLALERLVIARLAGRITREQVRQLKAHVSEEEKAQGQSEQRSIRLATEFHVLLAEMTGSPVLVRYVSELALRCGLILALYSRPHSADCAINEHREIIDALAAGDQPRAVALMTSHLDAVTSRALITPRPPKDRDIHDILAAYSERREEPKKSTRKRN
jgi:DNA-binding GntR family transcriptional regulator